MYVIEWDFLPASGRESEFVAAYGPDGVWVELFRQAQGFQGTELCKLPEKPGWYRTIDRWTSQEEYEVFLHTFASEYAKIDSACEALTAREVQVVQSGRSV